jgi:hypothetical protein
MFDKSTGKFTPTGVSPVQHLIFVAALGGRAARRSANVPDGLVCVAGRRSFLSVIASLLGATMNPKVSLSPSAQSLP